MNVLNKDVLEKITELLRYNEGDCIECGQDTIKRETPKSYHGGYVVEHSCTNPKCKAKWGIQYHTSILRYQGVDYRDTVPPNLYLDDTNASPF